MKISILIIIILFFNLKSTAQLTENQNIESFKQGSINCASISVIKLAIAKYGLNSVFLSVAHNNNNYHVIMRDSSVVDLTESDLLIMENLNYFEEKGNKNLYEYAKFLYAVMAKHKQKLKGYKNIKRAATHNIFYHLLAMDTEENLKYIGLSGHYLTVNKDEINNYQQIIITNNYHSVFSSMGIYDEFGDICSNNEFSKKHKNDPIENKNYILKD